MSADDIKCPLSEQDIDDIILLGGYRNAVGGIYATSVYAFAKEVAIAAIQADRACRDEQLREEIDQLRQDAARYRWLRKGESDDVAVVRGLGAMDYGMSAVVYTYSEEIDGDDLDATLDAAMAKENSND